MTLVSKRVLPPWLSDLQPQAQRILPSLILVSTISLLAYLAAQYWIPPERIHRVWPNISLTQATIFTIVGANLLVWQLWRFPPAYRLLNKYFIVSTAYPYTWSMLGSMFSHQSFGHLAINMGFLLLLPAASRLHEETERAVFVGVWLSSGLWASWASLVFSALRRDMLHTSLGASGAVMGVLSAYCAIHAE
jgi:rhomboid-like protein